jgi:hypothetical protein
MWKSLSAKAIATSWELPLYRLDMHQLGDRAIPASGRQPSLGVVGAQPRARRVVLS